jgi:hypothetical protein
MYYVKSIKDDLKYELYHTYNILMEEFYSALSEIMQKETYESSYADFKYTSLKKNNPLLSAINSYNLSDSSDPFYKKYNATNPYGIITEIRDIYSGEELIANADGSRGCKPTGFYNLSFTVAFKKHKLT